MCEAGKCARKREKNMHSYRKDYPRPQLVREDFTLLDGVWKFAFDDENLGEKQKWYNANATKAAVVAPWQDINVPFAYETKLSGIGDESFHKYVWYQREIEISEERLDNKRMILHFEGVDFYTKVWINGEMVGSHKGGYARFSFDITDYVSAGSNVVTIRVEDTFDNGQPRGKQRWKDESFACWYVQTTGIWKSVWMESVGMEYIKALKITPDWANRNAIIEADVVCDREATDLEINAKVTFEGTPIKEVTEQVNVNQARIIVNVERPDLFEWSMYEWRPDAPGLYDVELTLRRTTAKELEDGSVVTTSRVADKVNSYFGMREISIDKGNILLNGNPLYQRLILDQGYWRESHLTPPSEEALIKDIDTVMAMGYNGVRKHQKTEDERFLYWCDVKGLLVWSEVPAAYNFNDEAVEEFTKEWMEIVRQNYSHPCIITWTPFNESWGIGAVKTNRTHQHFTESIYHLTKCFDPYRPVIVNDGWQHTISDIITLHDYEESGDVFFDRYSKNIDKILTGEVYHCWNRSAFADGFEYKGQPIIISEFGGIAFNEDGGWGYGNKVKDKDDFIQRFDSITTAIKKLPFVCGYCYTQVSDVQQEINGLMDQDRNCKIDPAILKEINERIV